MLDIQNELETRGIPLQYVGVCDYKMPCIIDEQASLCTIRFGVSLDKNHKGIHMSRLCSILNDISIISNETVCSMLSQACNVLNTNYSKVEISSCFFLKKYAPVSRLESTIPYNVKIEGILNSNKYNILHALEIPFTSLCPCSKAISRYGAHNQRGYIKILLQNIDTTDYHKIINIVEKNVASSEMYEVLKRPDEKYVTETAYDNPKFVEDIVRDTIICINSIYNNNVLSIEAVNYESIHCHNAFAYSYIDDKAIR